MGLVPRVERIIHYICTRGCLDPGETFTYQIFLRDSEIHAVVQTRRKKIIIILSNAPYSHITVAHAVHRNVNRCNSCAYITVSWKCFLRAFKESFRKRFSDGNNSKSRSRSENRSVNRKETSLPQWFDERYVIYQNYDNFGCRVMHKDERLTKWKYSLQWAANGSVLSRASLWFVHSRIFVTLCRKNKNRIYGADNVLLQRKATYFTRAMWRINKRDGFERNRWNRKIIYKHINNEIFQTSVLIINE